MTSHQYRFVEGLIIKKAESYYCLRLTSNHFLPNFNQRTYPTLRQWAAVMKCLLEIKVAPHWCSHLESLYNTPKLAIQGQWPVGFFSGWLVAPATWNGSSPSGLFPHTSENSLKVILLIYCLGLGELISPAMQVRGSPRRFGFETPERSPNIVQMFHLFVDQLISH